MAARPATQAGAAGQPEVGTDGQAGGRGRGPAEAAGEHPEGVGGVEAGEDGPPVAALQLDPLGVHGHVDHAVGRGHHGQGRGQPAQPGGQGDGRQGRRVDGEGQAQAGPAAQVGAQLLRRTRQGVRPTEAGRLLVEHADAILDRLALASEQLAELSGLRRGRVRLGSFFTAFAQLTPQVCALAEARLPELAVEHELVDRRTAFRRLAAGELDVALVFEHGFEPDPPPDDVQLVPLFTDPARVLLPARHRLAGRSLLAVEDLAGDTWIRPHDGSAARLVDHFLEAAGLHPPALLAGHGDEPVETQVYVVAGDGVALAYRLNVIINPAEIAIRPLADPAPVRHVQAAVLRGQRAPGPLALLELLGDLAPPRDG